MGLTSNSRHISVNLSLNLESEFIYFLWFLAKLLRLSWKLTYRCLIYIDERTNLLSIFLGFRLHHLALLFFRFFLCLHGTFPHIHFFLLFIMPNWKIIPSLTFLNFYFAFCSKTLQQFCFHGKTASKLYLQREIFFTLFQSIQTILHRKNRKEWQSLIFLLFPAK